MLNLQFLGLNLNFAVNLLAALSCFGVFWLIFDAWLLRRTGRELLKWTGFLLLATGFLLRAAHIGLQTDQIAQLLDWLTTGCRVLGYGLIAIGQLADPLQQRPVYATDAALANLAPPAPAPPAAPPPIDTPDHQAPAAPPAPRRRGRPRKTAPPSTPAVLLSGAWASLSLPIVAAIVSWLYLRHATRGLERHLLPVAYGFGLLTLFELLSVLSGLYHGSNPVLLQWLAVFGLVWWLALLCLLVAALILSLWVWHYLTKRLQSQLFITMVAATLLIYLVSTIGFSYLLLRNIRAQSLADLQTASQILQYAIAGRQAETAAQAEAVAAAGSVTAAVAGHNRAALGTALTDYLPSHHLTSLIVTSASGQVLWRGEDPERWGDSRSADPLVRRALIGSAAASVVVTDGVAAPTVTLVAATPIRDAGGTIIGVAVAGRAISGAFVDGIRQSTSLDSSVYGGSIRATTTLTIPGSIDRAVGIKETSSAVLRQVLARGQAYTGLVTLQNRTYLAAYTPVRDVTNTPVGMLLVTRPLDALYAAANHSIQLTFLLAVGLVILSIVPVYFLSRYLSRQMQ